MTADALLSSTALPRFTDVAPEKIGPALDVALEAHRREVAAIKAAAGGGFDATVQPLERAEHALDALWSTVSHVKAVADSPDLRAAHAQGQARLVEYGMAMMQDRGLHDAIAAAADRPDFAALPAPQRRAVEKWLRDFKLSGVTLEGADADRFRAIGAELSQLATDFSNAVVDATEAWTEHVTDAAVLDGVPAADLAMLAAAAKAKGLEGWLVTLQGPSVQAVLTYARDRELRRRVYEAYGTRASDQGPHAGTFDNGPRIARILALRREAAQLLGFPTHVEHALATRMAKTPGEVRAFLLDLAERARSAAERELEELRAFARDELGLDPLEPWDMGFAGEALKRARHRLDASEVKAYFPVDTAMAGMFGLVKALFGIEARPRPDVETWHRDAVYYDLAGSDGVVFAGLYLDLYARDGKRGGAWMAGARSRFRDGNAVTPPAAYLTCNFSPPGSGADGDTPSLLTHDDVTTLLHEMGHCLHHLLTEVETPSVGGIAGVEWDAVELPSQLLENFGWDPATLKAMSRHVETGEPLPDALFARMLAARRFQAAMRLLRQLEFALFDLEVHAGDPDADVQAVVEAVRERVAVVRPPAWQRFASSFGHIFAGGYSAGYYSYLWAEVLALDAFAQFAAGADADVGARYRREVLGVGSTRPAADSFHAFVGRAPDPQALLERYGLEPEREAA